MARRLLVLLGVTVLLVVGGCGAGGPASSRLVGTWFPVDVSQDAGKPPADTGLQKVAFGDDGTWTISNDCTELGGSYDLEDDGTFSASEESASATPCAKTASFVSRNLVRADRVSFDGCFAHLEHDGRPVLTLRRCQRTDQLGGGPPDSGK